MKLSETCIRRPVLTTLVTASIIVFGAFAYRLLPVAALPAVDFPTIQVSANLPGASPETMASSVAQPLEKQFAQIPGVAQLTSTSSLGTTRIQLQFSIGRNLDRAARESDALIGGLEIQQHQRERGHDQGDPAHSSRARTPAVQGHP